MQAAKPSSPLGGSPAASIAATMRPIDSDRFSFSGFMMASAPLSPFCCIWSAFAWSCRYASAICWSRSASSLSTPSFAASGTVFNCSPTSGQSMVADPADRTFASVAPVSLADA